jgi:hypothetical protein
MHYWQSNLPPFSGMTEWKDVDSWQVSIEVMSGG